MNKFLKYVLLGTAALAIVVVAGIAYLAATFDPNDYKAQIIKAVQDSKHRNLRLDGDIKLSFYPNIGASLSKVSLSEFKSDKEFVYIESARVSLALMPLLHKQFVVEEVAVSGLKARLVTHKNDTSNIDDLLDQPAQKQQQQNSAGSTAVQFDIASVAVEKSDLSYHDEVSGARYNIRDLNLKTGRIAIGVPSKIDLSLGIQSNQPKLDFNLQLRSTLAFDLVNQAYQLRDLELQAGGTVLDIGNLKVTASGEVSADLDKREFTSKKLVVSASGVKEKNSFDIALDAPSLNLSKDKYHIAKLAMKAAVDGSFGNISANLSLPGLDGNPDSFNAGALSLDMDVKQPEQTFRVKLSSPLSGSIKTQQFSFGNLKLMVTASGDKLPNKSVSSEMKGSLQVDILKQTVQASLAGGLLQSQIKAKFGVKGFSGPAIKFDVDVDQFDADVYMPHKSVQVSRSQTKEAEPPLDLSGLRSLDLDGSLRVGKLKAMNVTTTQLRMDVKAQGGVVNINPLSAKLYQGSMSGSMSINAKNIPSIVVNQKLSGIAIAPLLKDAADLDLAEGRGDIVADLVAQGNTVSELKRSLNGNVSVNLENGAIMGINLTKLVQGIQNLNRDTRAQTLGVDKSEKTEFSEFRASFKVRNGVAHNDDLAVKSTVLRLSGNGDIDIGHDNMDYNAKAVLAKSEQGRTATLPVNVSGSFDALKFKIDYGALLVDVAKQKIDEKKEKIKEDAKAKLQEELKKSLKGLFK